VLTANSYATLNWNKYYDSNTAGYNIYCYCSTNGTVPTDSTLFTLVQQITDPNTTTCQVSNTTSLGKQLSANTALNYGFNPLSDYYTSEIQEFFDMYSDPNSFVIHTTGVTWMGNTTTYTPDAAWNPTHASYTVLALTAQNAYNSILPGDVVRVYQPFFSKNTCYVIDNAPPMPNWIGTSSENPPGSISPSQYESPAQMIFGCDGILSSNANDPDITSNADLTTALGSIENCIGSAFNRGIATNPAFQPDNWAAFPQLLSAPIVAPDTNSEVATETTYYYAVSAVNPYGETTISLEVGATVDVGQSATLNWEPSSSQSTQPACYYNIYRGTSPGALTLLGTTRNQFYTDEGGSSSGSQTPHTYFQPGSTANWYAAVVQTNSLLDPVNGFSVNGMSYGFPYSDQGGLSTNVTLSYIPEYITINLGTETGAGFVTQSLPDAMTDTFYQQNIVTTLEGAQYSATGDFDQTGLSLNPDTGIISGTATSTANTYDFTIVATKDTETISQPFSLTVNSNTDTLFVLGSVQDVLTLPTGDTDNSGGTSANYSAQVYVTGGSGEYTMAIVGHLPNGVHITGLEPGESLTSVNHVFTLEGYLKKVWNDPNIGFQVTIADAHNSSLTLKPTLSLEVDSLTQITPTTLTEAYQGMYYYTTLATDNASSTVTYTVPADDLPDGLMLTPWGVLYGTPTENGSFPLSVTASDAAGGTVTKTLNFTVGEESVGVSVLPITVPNDTAAHMVYTFTRTGSTSGALLVDFNVGGTAEFDTNYTVSGAYSFTASAGSVAIPIGAASATVIVTPTGDKITTDETVILTVIDGTNYVVGTPIAATGTILETDLESTIGLYNAANGNFLLRTSNTSGLAEFAFQYGPAGTNWTPLAGDWDGDGVDTIGLYNPALAKFYLRNENSAGTADIVFQYGSAGSNWTPLAGDWDGDGVDTIGLYNPTLAKFYLRNENSAGTAEIVFQYGSAGSNWSPVVGDWIGQGFDAIGLYNPALAKFYLRNDNSAGVADIVFQYGAAGNRWVTCTGDWIAQGFTTIGLYNQTSAKFHLRDENSSGAADNIFQYGPAANNWQPITGYWGIPSSSSLKTNTVTVSTETALSQSELPAIAPDAVNPEPASKIDADATTMLQSATIAIANLTGPKLAVVENGENRIAVEPGKLVDPIAPSYEEDTATTTNTDISTRSSLDAVDQIDLLTVVREELENIADLDDLADFIARNEIGLGIASR
jgi:hypothetical protein